MDTSQQLVFVIIWYTVLLAGVSSEVTCTPAEEGQLHIIGYRGPVIGSILSWTTSSFTLCYCNIDAKTSPPTVTCMPCRSNDFEITADHEGENIYTTNITIKNPTQSQDSVVFNCISSLDTLGSCELKVFVRPVNPSCQAPVVDENGGITVTCTATDLYPAATCSFYVRTNGTVLPELSPPVRITGPSYSCTKTVSGNTLKWGRHEFQVRMYPLIDGQKYDMGESISSFTQEILIEFPEGFLNPDCPTGDKYIKENTTSTCTCRRTDMSVLPATVRWSNNISGNPSSDVLTFIATRNTAGFTCLVVTNGVGWSVRVDFKPAIAYGPDKVFVQEGAGLKVFHVCGSDVQIKPKCQVPVADVNPAPIFSIKFDNNPTRPGVLGNKNGDIYSHTEEHSVSHGGRYFISCNVSNSGVEGLFSLGSTDLTITKPPLPPVLEIMQGSQSINVNDVTIREDQATFRCRIQGGFPTVANITVSCGQSSSWSNTVQNANEAQLIVPITRHMTGDSCSCSAAHLSTCYNENRKTTAPFNLLYRASVSNFTVSSKSSAGLSVTVAKGDSVTFHCQTGGNPRPKGEITMERFPNSLQSDVKDNLQCTDTGTYVCQARNEEGSEEPLRKDVQVNVNCTFQLEHPEENDRKYNGIRDNDFTISIRVVGFPPPPKSGFRLLEKSKNDVLKLRSGNVTEHYEVDYIDDKAPYGRVQLTIQKLRQSDFKSYTLVIENDIGTLEYDFGISEVDKTIQTNSSDTNVGTIIDGVIVGMLAIVTGILIYIVIKLRRTKGTLRNRRRTSIQIQDFSSASIIESDDGYLRPA